MLKIGVITMALMSFLHAGWFGDLFDSTPTPPISIPIDLSKAGSVVETEMRIKERHDHIFSLHFFETPYKDDGGVDAKRVRKIVGYNAYDPFNGSQLIFRTVKEIKNIESINGKNIDIDENYNPDGVSIPIKLTVYKIENTTQILVHEKIYKSKGNNGGTRSYTSRDFAGLRLVAGNYLVRAEAMQDFSELTGRKVEFFIEKLWTK